MRRFSVFGSFPVTCVRGSSGAPAPAPSSAGAQGGLAGRSPAPPAGASQLSRAYFWLRRRALHSSAQKRPTQAAGGILAQPARHLIAAGLTALFWDGSCRQDAVWAAPVGAGAVCCPAIRSGAGGELRPGAREPAGEATTAAAAQPTAPLVHGFVFVARGLPRLLAESRGAWFAHSAACQLPRGALSVSHQPRRCPDVIVLSPCPLPLCRQPPPRLIPHSTELLLVSALQMSPLCVPVLMLPACSSAVAPWDSGAGAAFSLMPVEGRSTHRPMPPCPAQTGQRASLSGLPAGRSVFNT